MKLKSITFNSTPKLPGLRPGDLTTLDCEQPVGVLRGWRALIRGASVFFVSPPGWTPNGNQGVVGDACVIHEVPRMNCYFQWSGHEDGDVEKVAKFTTPPFGPAPVVEAKASLLAQVPGFDAT